MQLPSLAQVVDRARDAALRFPLVVLAGLACVVAAIMCVGGDPPELAIRALYSASLGISLLLAAALFGERSGPRATLVANLLALGALAVVFLGEPNWRDPILLRRYIQLSLGFHLLVAFLPYARIDEPNGFWHYNKDLFLRFLISGLYSAVLFGGLSIALLALDKLFGLHVDEDQYARLWIVMAFLFNTWFFLGGVPGTLSALQTRDDYPTGLKVFSQFILVPIVTLYMVILTAYLAKIAVTRVWPSGWIGYLVSSVSVLGILSLLLVHPIRERAENRWIAGYARWFYVVLFPSVIMLILAVAKRVGQYGITENRYFLLVLAGWLTLISLVFIFRPRTGIRVIPATLCVVVLATCGGPWGAYQVSEASQVGRLQGLLESNAMLESGSIRQTSGVVSELDRREISSIVRYLVDTHGVQSIAPWFSNRLADVDSVRKEQRHSDHDQTVLVLSKLGVEYLPPGVPDTQDAFQFSLAGNAEAWDIREYSHAVSFQGRPPINFQVNGVEYQLVTNPEGGTFELLGPDGILLEFPTSARIEQLHGGEPVQQRSREELTVVGASETTRASLTFRSLVGHRMDGVWFIDAMEGDLAVSFTP